MTVTRKAFLSIALSLPIITSSMAAEIIFSDYVKAPDAWKRGFLIGLSSIYQPSRNLTKSHRIPYETHINGASPARQMHLLRDTSTAMWRETRRTRRNL